MTDNIYTKVNGVFFMRINKMNNVLQVYNKNNGVNKAKDNNKTKEDQINISDKAKEVQFGLSKLKDVEEIRTEKIETIKEQIKTGTYNIDGEKIAERMLENVNFNKRI